MDKTLKGRLELHLPALKDTYFKVYGNFGATMDDFNAFVDVVKNGYNERKESLRELDKRDSKWYMSKDMVGMMIYVDLFAGDLNKMIDKIPYLTELGITYVHLMPLLKPRAGENDGGYAVEDYRDIDERLGTKEDFVNLLDALREAGIDVCIDYVLNHTADSHEWAVKALDGSKFHQDLYIMFNDRTIPDLYDKTVPEVLPDKCPGNFTFKEEINKWVFTSFSDFQWDLNFKNPKVLELMTDTLLFLSNSGVNMIRLDAIPFMWKEVGTMCRNLDPIHDLMHLLHIVKDIACPSLALLGEAIVEPHEIIKYFGSDEVPECGVLYNANFMVNIWNALAARDVRLMSIDNERFYVPSTGCFMNYVRCHDDIGWGFNEEAIRSFGLDPHSHKQFLIDFYSKDFEGSFSRGEIYQYNPVTHDARTNGTLASLAGLQKAIEESDLFEKEVAINRILLMHALIMSHRGIPLIYSGDEIATLNDCSYLKDPDKAAEGRWLHRPFFDWSRAELRHDLLTPEGRVYQGLQNQIKIRKENSLLNGDLDAHVINTTNNSVYAFYKQNHEETMVCLFNFSENNQYISTDVFRTYGIYGSMTDLIQGKTINFSNGYIHLHPYEFLWVKPKQFIK